jgi:hypothetical protein
MYYRAIESVIFEWVSGLLHHGFCGKKVDLLIGIWIAELYDEETELFSVNGGCDDSQ